MIAGIQRQEVVVTDVRMRLGSMLLFMVKWAIFPLPFNLSLNAAAQTAKRAMPALGGIQPRGRCVSSRTARKETSNHRRLI
jgi:hypothetical protein